MPGTTDKIKQLTETFNNNIEYYKSGSFNETQLRREFIDPFFAELGWDVENKNGYAEAYKDVIHEYSLKTKDVREAPDYCFRIGGTRKFFIEAKKPSVNLKDDIHPAFQLRRYAWSAKLPLSILTDFEEFAVYDCRIPPKKNDKASTARIIYYNYEDYISRWDEIQSIFSREAILKGSFDKYAGTNKNKKGTAEVDETFLKVIEGWREFLARNIALRNPNLTTRELNFAVQKTIDRIIFLRICEDRGIEEYGQIMNLMNGTNVYKRMTQIFTRADEKYNSGLFHFEVEKGRAESPDEITPHLEIDDKTLKEIIKNLYYPESPFEFSVLPSDILGQVYEQFLGKVIRLTDGHHAIIDDKPEVKKAGGVYYTPTYIVKYIVENTLGKILEELHDDKDYKEIKKALKKVSEIKVLDPACGSGSFLLEAYQYLLDWHLKTYASEDETLQRSLTGKNPQVYQAENGDYRLTTAERKRILLNNIYGADIDSQAVEVTKLSLLLKVLEGESNESLTSQIKMFHERALPDLGDNIKCGNSLIGPDFYNQMEMNFLDDEEKLRINVFDWNSEFKNIMSNGGFDVVIGNPPYVRIQAMKEWAKEEVEFYKSKYKSASKGNYDLYVVFVEQGLNLISSKGLLGFILPHKFFNSQYGESLRELIAKGKNLTEIIHFGFKQVFKDATTYTALLFLDKSEKKIFHFTEVKDLELWQNKQFENKGYIKGQIELNNLSSKEWNFVVGDKQKLFNKLKTLETLDLWVDVFVGLQTSADNIFILNKMTEDENTLNLFSKSLNKEIILEKNIAHPLVSGTDVKRYNKLNDRQYIIFPYNIENEKASIIEEGLLKTRFPLAFNYLLENKKILENRERGKFKGKYWYRFGRNQNLGIQNRKKICVPRLVERLNGTLDEFGEFFLDNVDVGGITFKEKFRDYELKFLLGLLNSKLLQWYFPFVSAPFRGGWFSANKQFLEQLPIPFIEINDSKIREDVLLVTQLVQRELELKKTNNKTPQEKTALQRQIEATDKQIDQLVYQLYGLTAEEIRIVEG